MTYKSDGFNIALCAGFSLQTHFYVITDSELCTFCNIYPETLNHLFWECEYTSKLWEEIHEWIKELFEVDICMNKIDIIIGKHYKC